MHAVTMANFRELTAWWVSLVQTRGAFGFSLTVTVTYIRVHVGLALEKNLVHLEKIFVLSHVHVGLALDKKTNTQPN